MEVILLKDIKSVGKKGEVVNAKEGYAKNFLIAKGLAVQATADELNKLQSKKDKVQRDEKKILEEANVLKEKIEGKTIAVQAKAGQDGKIFGSVTNQNVVDVANKTFGIKIDKKKIQLNPEHIKQLGEYEAVIKLHKEVSATIKLKVEGK